MFFILISDLTFKCKENMRQDKKQLKNVECKIIADENSQTIYQCMIQGPRRLRKCAGAKGGTKFLSDFLLHF